MNSNSPGRAAMRQVLCPGKPDRDATETRRLPLALVLLAAFMVAGSPVAEAGPGTYGDNDLRGEWIYSGLLKFGAPIPFPALQLHEAPPHDFVNPGDTVGIWGSILGIMTFDGGGGLANEDVFKTGELQPLPPFPLPFVPPLPEVGTGTYSVSDKGIVQISLLGRDPANPEGQVDFESDMYCLLNRQPWEMKCVYSRFQTFFVDPNGYHAPITGIVTFTRRH
jgi:hypothetical protein